LRIKRTEARPVIVFIGNQLAGPVLTECLELSEKSLAACRLGKDWEHVDAVAGDIVECAREVEVRPFAG